MAESAWDTFVRTRPKTGRLASTRLQPRFHRGKPTRIIVHEGPFKKAKYRRWEAEFDGVRCGHIHKSLKAATRCRGGA